MNAPCGCPIRDGYGYHGPDCPAIDAVTDFDADPALDRRHDIREQAARDEHEEAGQR